MRRVLTYTCMHAVLSRVGWARLHVCSITLLRGELSKARAVSFFPLETAENKPLTTDGAEAPLEYP